MKFVLASRSPRRREYLEGIGLDFEVIEPGIDRTPDPVEDLTVVEAIRFAVDMARQKGEAYAKTHPNQMVISADTVVFADGHIYGKPADLREARKALRRLYNRTHIVVTALALHYKGECYTGTDTTEVTFDSLTKEEEDIFIKKAGIKDKAGSYAIQGVGGILVRKIHGDFYNVVGIPLNLLDPRLREAGFPGLLHVIK
jgi:septum formation protein